eukprot:75942_1
MMFVVSTCYLWYITLNIAKSNDISWYQFGGNSQHTGYVEHPVKISQNSNYNITFYQEWKDSLGLSLVTAHKNYIYYWSLGSNNSESTFYCQNIPTSEIIWNTSLDININFCSQPSLTLNEKYLISTCYEYGNYTFLVIKILNASNGAIISNDFKQRLPRVPFGIWPLYSPVIGDNVGAFLIAWPTVIGSNQLNHFTIAEYSIEPFQQISAYDMQYTLGINGAYNPLFQCYYTQGAMVGGTPYNKHYFFIGEWENIWPYRYEIPNQLGGSVGDIIVLSLKYNMSFVSATSLCAVSWNNTYPPQNNMNELWCFGNDSYTDMGIPVIDENNGIVYAYSSQQSFIYALDMFDGSVVKKYGDSEMNVECNWNYGGYIGINRCLGHQPLVTENNVFWTNGTDIAVFDKESEDIVYQIDNVCNVTSDAQIGMYLEWSNDNLIVVCYNKLIAYQFV